MFKILAVISLFAVLGCATEGKFRDMLDTYEGTPIDDAVRNWGPPDKTYTLTDGDKLYTFNKSNGAIVSWGRAVPIRCSVTFTVDSVSQKIKGYRYEGNACKQK